MSADGDDLEVIDLVPEPASPKPSGTRRSRRRVGTVVVGVAVLAGGLFVGGTFVSTALGHRSHDSQARSSDTIVLPTATAAPAAAPRASGLAIDPDAEFVGEMGLLAPGVGWALNGLALYRTVDDGTIWSDITPFRVYDPIAHIDALDFLDADHAWAATAVNSQPLTIDRTVDGGRSWQALLPNVCGTTSTSSAAPCGAPVAIDFIDRAHGWSVFSPAGGSGTLLASRDGGTTWSVVGLVPFTGSLHMVDQADGWGVSANGDALYRTTDGGQTWRPVTLPPGPANAAGPVAIGAPQFFGRDDIVSAGVTERGSGPPTITVFESRDGGATWSAQRAPVTGRVDADDAADIASYRFSASTLSDWTVLAGSQLAVTHDAGRHWSTLTPTQGRLDDVAFASRSSGWVVGLAGPCAPSAVDSCTNELLFRTTDGGKTWQPASPTVGITAGRLP